MQRFNFVWFCFVATHLLVAECTINLEVTLYSYRNPTSSDCSGSSCGTTCDNQFTFCLRSNLSSSSCTFGSVRSAEISDDDFTFSPSILTQLGLSNPISFQSIAPIEEIVLQINILDNDIGTANDDVDAIIINIPNVNVDSTFSPRQSYNGTCGRATIELSYHLTCRRNGFALPDCTSCLPNFQGTNCNDCTPNYFPTGDCNVHCIPQDSTSGHFACDPRTGAIRCLSGFTDPQTNCTTEVPTLSPFTTPATSRLPTPSPFTTPTAIGAYVGAGLGALLLCCCAWCCCCMCLKWSPRKDRITFTWSYWREFCQMYRKHCCCCCCCTWQECIGCPAACCKACVECPAACVEGLADCAKGCCKACVECPTTCAMACCKACIECPATCAQKLCS